MELAFLSAVEQARLVRARRDLVGGARRALPRADRAARSDAELLRHRLRRGGARRRAGASTRRRATRRSAVSRSRSRTSPRRRASARRTRPARTPNYVPDFDTAVVRRHPRGRVRDRRQDEHARVRHGRVHRVRAQRRDAEPVEPRADARRVERRRRGGRSPPASSRSRTRPTAAARSASPRRAAASSG